jgi:hypothetical protein
MGFTGRELGIGDPDDRDIFRTFQHFERLDCSIMAGLLVQEIQYFGKDKISDDSGGLPVIYRTDNGCCLRVPLVTAEKAPIITTESMTAVFIVRR